MKEKIRRCPQCGRELPMEDNQCPYCGAEVKKARRIGKWILIPLVLLMLALGAYGLMQNVPLHIGHTVKSDETDASTAAREYLADFPLAEEKLRRWLDQDGYSSKEIDKAIEDCGADWNANALATAEQMLQEYGYSVQSLQTSLVELEDFTPEQAAWAVSRVEDVDWRAQALQMALDYLNAMPMSRNDLQEQLVFEGVSQEDAEYAVENCGADWKEEALRSVEEYRDILHSEEEIRSHLEFRGYTEEEIQYAIDHS